MHEAAYQGDTDAVRGLILAKCNQAWQRGRGRHQVWLGRNAFVDGWVGRQGRARGWLVMGVREGSWVRRVATVDDWVHEGCQVDRVNACGRLGSSCPWVWFCGGMRGRPQMSMACG